MQKIVFGTVLFLIIALFAWNQYRTLPEKLGTSPVSETKESQPIVEDIHDGQLDPEINFSLNADSLDQYLSQRNPLYQGGFIPALDELGTLSPASRYILEQFEIYEFIDQTALEADFGRSAILEYARGDTVDDTAANFAGFYAGRVQLGKHSGTMKLSLVPVGGANLVYDGQWQFHKGLARRFRRIPEQPHWLNPYRPTVWMNETEFRLEIPRGALTNTGLPSPPLPPGAELDAFVGYDLRGEIPTDNTWKGSVDARFLSVHLGEVRFETKSVGTFSFSPDQVEP